jgi:hypothetical protein
MKEAFQPFLPAVFDLVERAVNMDLGLSIADANDTTPPVHNSKVARIKLDLKFVGLKSLELNTSALE